MRIRKHQLRVSNVGGESSSGAPRTDPGSHEQSQELALSSRGVKEKPGGETSAVQTDVNSPVEEQQQQQEHEQQRPGVLTVPHGIERVDSTPPRSAFTWLDKLRHAKGFTELEPYSNLEDFVSSLTKRDVDGIRAGSSSTSAHSEEIVEGADLNHLVGGVDLHSHLLVRHSSVCSESGSQRLNVGHRAALEWCAESAQGNEILNFQLQSDASLPNAKDRVDHASTDLNMPSSQQGAEVMERLLTNKEEKQKGEDQRLKSSSYWGQSRNTSSWMRDNLKLSEIERSYHGESSGKIQVFAGTSSRKPLNYAISDHVSCQPTTGEVAAVLLEQQQRHVARDYSASVVAKSAGTLQQHEASPQIASAQDPPTESFQRRSIRKRRISSSTVSDAEQHLRPAPPLSPDHPAQQVKGSLAFSLYTVFSQAGKAGLTAREAMSDIMAQRLAGVEEGAVQSSRRIGKLLRNSPYYMEVGKGKFALCTAVIEVAREEVPPQEEEQEEEESQQSSSSEKESESISDETHSGEAVRKKRKRAVTVSEADQTGATVKSKPVRTGRPKKLKYMKQENAESLGNQCNRTDGKGWVCPLLAKPGYQLCDHHLDKLRCKPGSRSKKKKLLKMTAAAAAAAAADAVEGEASTREELSHSVDTARHELTTP